MEQLTENVESMNKDDIDKIVGKVTEHNYSLTRYGSLLVNETNYWFATKSESAGLWYIYDYTSRGHNNNGLSYNTSWGIRAKVTLVERE